MAAKTQRHLKAGKQERAANEPRLSTLHDCTNVSVVYGVRLSLLCLLQATPQPRVWLDLQPEDRRQKVPTPILVFIPSNILQAFSVLIRFTRTVFSPTHRQQPFVPSGSDTFDLSVSFHRMLLDYALACPVNL